MTPAFNSLYIETWITSRDLSQRMGSVFALRFLTPFGLIKEGEILKDLRFESVFPFMLRKYSAVMQQYVSSMDVRKAIQESLKVRLLGNRLSEVNFKYKGRTRPSC